MLSILFLLILVPKLISNSKELITLLQFASNAQMKEMVSNAEEANLMQPATTAVNFLPFGMDPNSIKAAKYVIPTFATSTYLNAKKMGQN